MLERWLPLPAGELHGPYTYLAVYTDRRSRAIYVPQAVRAACEAYVEITRRNEALRLEISQIRRLWRIVVGGPERRARAGQQPSEDDFQGLAEGAGLRA